jgi:hypothetical protein
MSIRLSLSNAQTLERLQRTCYRSPREVSRTRSRRLSQYCFKRAGLTRLRDHLERRADSLETLKGVMTPRAHEAQGGFAPGRCVIPDADETDDDCPSRWRPAWVRDWVQVAGCVESFGVVSCAGSTKALTATNQEVAGSSPAGPKPSRCARWLFPAVHREASRLTFGSPRMVPSPAGPLVPVRRSV